MARRSSEQSVSIAGRTLRVSNLDKVLYPDTGTTKGEVLDYYMQVSQTLISHAAWRPATRKRWVDGVGTEQDPVQPFFRKDLEDSAPSWIPTARIEHSDHVNTYPLVNEPAVLAWMGQVAALEIHVPQWRFDTSLNPQNPDRMVLDLDPGPGVGLTECAQVARLCRELLEQMGLEVYPVTSGSKGIHLYAELDGTNTSDQISAVAKEMARSLEQDHPELVVSSMKRSLRVGKVFLDWSQNNASKTTVCPYSLRGRARPTVAAPRTWEELEDPDLRHLEFTEVLRRLEEGPDPMAGLAGTVPSGTDRLSTYRSMRNARETPEPVPDYGQPAVREQNGDGPIFVIQKHRARRLHWDFRLEHDGVLVSWAVPKGPPLEGGTHRLAVMTEDHPLDYATFHGTIPKGQYGAGTVEIWDSGRCTIEKWREGKEVIAVLEGTPSGGLQGVARRYVLVNAPGMGDERNWLLQLTKEQPEPQQSAQVPEPTVTPPIVGDDFEVPLPMLATAGSPADIDDTECWAFEMKWDGYRAILQVQNGHVMIRSRTGQDLTGQFPELQELAGLVPQGSVLDGEIVSMDRSGRPDFGVLQQRLSLGRKRAVKNLDVLPEVHLMLFDALVLPGTDGEAPRENLMGQSYRQRRARLFEAVAEGNYVHLPPAHEGDLRQALATSAELRLEGVLAKECDSDYEPGTRSKSWIKIKHQRHQEVVIIGWRQGKGERGTSLGSLLMAIPENGQLRYVGRVGTGFSQDQLVEARAKLGRQRRKTPPAKDVPAEHRRDAVWVTPSYVGEVQYSEITSDGRLRHPVWRGWRPDKDAQQVRWEHGG